MVNLSKPEYGVLISNEDTESADVTAVIANNMSKDNGEEEMRDREESQSTKCDNSLRSWDLPEKIVDKYHSLGITELFDWQVECLHKTKALDGKNLVYSAPTSAGKTIIIELLMLKQVLERRKKAILILPFVSVVREKMIYLQNLYQDVDIRVDGYMGSYHPVGGFDKLDIAVCTIEKANGLINRLMDQDAVDDLGCVIVDELHMVGDSHRGYLLELLLTKLLYITMTRTQDGCIDHSIQLVGMSATLPNLDLLALWLKADLYHTNFRPVPLKQYVKIATQIYDHNMTSSRTLSSAISGAAATACPANDDDEVVTLTLETVCTGHGVLIFCPSKQWCEKLSENIARSFYMIASGKLQLQHHVVGDASSCISGNVSVESLKQQFSADSIGDALEQLRRTAIGLDKQLALVIQFNHGGKRYY